VAVFGPAAVCAYPEAGCLRGQPTDIDRRGGPTLNRVQVAVEQLIDRDGDGCVWCGRVLWRRDLTLEHVVPRSRGGHMVAENALVACRSCNRRRGSRPVDAYVRDLLREGAEVNLSAVRRSLTRLTRSDRRAHREAAERQLRRLPAD
jgi:5-methylcytosine-specific restriction endonuclease McrA